MRRVIRGAYLLRRFETVDQVIAVVKHGACQGATSKRWDGRDACWLLELIDDDQAGSIPDMFLNSSVPTAAIAVSRAKFPVNFAGG